MNWSTKFVQLLTSSNKSVSLTRGSILPRRYVPKWLVYLAAPYIGFTRDFVKKNIAYPLAFDNTKSISDLKMEYHSFEETILDHVEQLRKDELVAIK